MNIKPATTHPLATQEIGGMIDMIQTLIDKGYAYNVNGTVYYRTRKFEGYGKLSKKNIDDLEAGHRDIKVAGESEKEDPLDFVLWKPKKKASLTGNHRGVREDRAGILSVLSCLRSIWQTRLIFMRAVRI